MFQFPGFAFIPYGFRNEYLLLISASPKIAKPPRRPQTFRFEAAQAKARPTPRLRPSRVCLQIDIDRSSLRNNRDRRWVSPFGNSRIKACSRLPETYRMGKPTFDLCYSEETICRCP